MSSYSFWRAVYKLSSWSFVTTASLYAFVASSIFRCDASLFFFMAVTSALVCQGYITRTRPWYFGSSLSVTKAVCAPLLRKAGVGSRGGTNFSLVSSV